MLNTASSDGRNVHVPCTGDCVVCVGHRIAVLYAGEVRRYAQFFIHGKRVHCAKRMDDDRQKMQGQEDAAQHGFCMPQE